MLLYCVNLFIQCYLRELQVYELALLLAYTDQTLDAKIMYEVVCENVLIKYLLVQILIKLLLTYILKFLSLNKVILLV